MLPSFLLLFILQHVQSDCGTCVMDASSWWKFQAHGWSLTYPSKTKFGREAYSSYSTNVLRESQKSKLHCWRFASFLVGVIQLQIYSMVYVDFSLIWRYTSHVIVVPAHKSYSVTGLDKPVGLQEVEASRIFSHSAHEDDKVVSHMHWALIPPRRYPWYSFLLEA